MNPAMQPAEELALYRTDRAAWARYVAPRWAELLAQGTRAEKKALWDLAGEELQAALRALKPEARKPR